VLRRGPDGAQQEVSLTATVSTEGKIGFAPVDTSEDSTLVTVPPQELRTLKRGSEPYAPAAVGAITRPGTRILSVAGQPVSDFRELRAALLTATALAVANASETAPRRSSSRSSPRCPPSPTARRSPSGSR